MGLKMRIWSIDLKYLDSKRLNAVWRETLLAKKVLEGKTKGYKNHPQLNRFKAHKEPLKAINLYLLYIYQESLNRGYKYNKNKINWDLISNCQINTIPVSTGQISYDLKLLENKLNQNLNVEQINIVPIFKTYTGNIEKFEKVKKF